MTRAALFDQQMDIASMLTAQGQKTQQKLGTAAAPGQKRIGALLGGAIVTERIFNIPGIGGYIYRSIRSRDGASVVGAVTVLVIVYLFVNLLVDLLYGLLDPRISHD